MTPTTTIKTKKLKGEDSYTITLSRQDRPTFTCNQTFPHSTALAIALFVLDAINYAMGGKIEIEPGVTK
jgi:hypothetical protein